MTPYFILLQSAITEFTVSSVSNVQTQSITNMGMTLNRIYTIHSVSGQKPEKCQASINSQQRDSS